MNDHDRRLFAREKLDPEDWTFAALFEGLRHLNARYERAVRWIAVAVIVGILVSGIEAGLLYYSFAQRAADRIALRRALERGTREVAFQSCERQNEHRGVEREILKRSLDSSGRLKAILPAAEIAHERLELRRDIALLAPVNCHKVIKAIPTR